MEPPLKGIIFHWLMLLSSFIIDCQWLAHVVAHCDEIPQKTEERNFQRDLNYRNNWAFFVEKIFSQLCFLKLEILIWKMKMKNGRKIQKWQAFFNNKKWEIQKRHGYLLFFDYCAHLGTDFSWIVMRFRHLLERENLKINKTKGGVSFLIFGAHKSRLLLACFCIILYFQLRIVSYFID